MRELTDGEKLYFAATGKETPEEKPEMVNHPAHYNWHPRGIECISVIEFFPFNIGSAMKYLWRQDYKEDAIQDLEKAIWYIQREIERIKQFG